MKKILALVLCLLVCVSGVYADEVMTELLDNKEVVSIDVKPVKVPVLMYHHISENVTNSAIVSPLKFEADMMYLMFEGYTPIFISDLEAYLRGEAALPEKPIMITFDDGYTSNYTHAFQVAKANKLKMTISMIGWSVGRSFLMDDQSPIFPHFTWDQAIEMQESGLVDLQHHTFDLHNGHGYTRFDNRPTGFGILPLKGEEVEAYAFRLGQDLGQMQDLMDQYLQKQSKAFFYPFGAYNDTTEAVLKDLGFTSTFTTVRGVREFSTLDDMFAIPRLNVSQSLSRFRLIEAIRDLELVE